MVVYSAVVCGQGQGDSGMVVVLVHKVRSSVAWLFVLLCFGCWKVQGQLIMLLCTELLVGPGQGNVHAMPGTLRGNPAQVQCGEVHDPEESTA